MGLSSKPLRRVSSARDLVDSVMFRPLAQKLSLRVSSPFLRHFSKERAGKSVRPGCALVLDGVPHRCTKMIQGKRGKGGGFVRATLRNLISLQTFEKTFNSDEVVEHADLEKRMAQYSWEDSNSLVFLSSDTFEEIRVPKELAENKDYLLEGSDVKLLLFRDAVIGVEIPEVIEYTVVSLNTDKSKQGDQEATLNSGAKIMVPLFIKENTRIKVNTLQGTYVERA